MASLVYNAALLAAYTGGIDFASDDFKVILVTSAYVPDKRTHAKRSDVIGEVSAPGYTTGGVAVSVSAALDNANDRVDVLLGAASWLNSTIAASGAIYLKLNGGDPADDDLVRYVDFGGDIVSTNGIFDLTESTFRIQN